MRLPSKSIYFCVLLIMLFCMPAYSKIVISHKSEIAISLGSDAYLIEMTPASKIPKRKSATTKSVLIAPGSVLLTFPDKSFNHRGIKRILAINELGEWLFVPSESSNLIPESTILKLLVKTIDPNENWRVFTKTQAALNGKIYLTRGEIHRTQFNRETKSYSARLLSNDHLVKNHIDALIKLYGRKEQYSLELNPLLNPFGFDVPLVEIEDILINAGLTKSRIKRANVYGLSATERRQIANIWPKLYVLGQLYSAGCNASEITRESGWQETVKKTLTGGFSFSVFGVDTELKAQLELGTERSNSLKVSYKSGTSSFETAAVVVGDGVTVLHYGEAAECTNGSRSEPVWNRMNWEDSAPYFFGRSSFSKYSDPNNGIVWNKKAGHLEINCFHGAYQSLLSQLGKNRNIERAKAFLLRYLKPADGKWRDVFSCAYQAAATIPTTRPLSN